MDVLWLLWERLDAIGSAVAIVATLVYLDRKAQREHDARYREIGESITAATIDRSAIRDQIQDLPTKHDLPKLLEDSLSEYTKPEPEKPNAAGRRKRGK